MVDLVRYIILSFHSIASSPLLIPSPKLPLKTKIQPVRHGTVYSYHAVKILLVGTYTAYLPVRCAVPGTQLR
jgi:hypothetical protein